MNLLGMSALLLCGLMLSTEATSTINMNGHTLVLDNVNGVPTAVYDGVALPADVASRVTGLVNGLPVDAAGNFVLPNGVVPNIPQVNNNSTSQTSTSQTFNVNGHTLVINVSNGVITSATYDGQALSADAVSKIAKLDSNGVPVDANGNPVLPNSNKNAAVAVSASMLGLSAMLGAAVLLTVL